MRRIDGWLISLLLAGTFLFPAQAQPQGQNARPWWVEGEFGEGQIKLSSDQSPGSRNATFAMGFAGGHRLGNQARVGLELNGWLLQAFNLNDPTVGESVSNVLGVMDVFPVRKVPFFFRGGAGAGFYDNNRPEGYTGRGFAWIAGGGYEFRLSDRFGVAPIVAYSSGGFGDVRNPLTVQTGRRYSVVEFKVALFWHFGKTE